MQNSRAFCPVIQKFRIYLIYNYTGLKWIIPKKQKLHAFVSLCSTKETMNEPSLKQKTIGALLWNLLDRAGQQVLLFIVGVLVANILSVEDYALVGMLAIFSALGNIVLDSGFSAALIRKQDATETDYNSVFYFNIFISICLYLLLFICAPFIARFFNQPLLTDLARVIFLALPFNSLSLIQSTLLNKQVCFKILTQTSLLALTLSSTCSLIMAYSGMGVWTLAWQPVILAFLRSVLLWCSNKWRPQLLFSISSIKELFGFSSKLLLASLVNSIFTNIYSVAIGKLYPPVQLGYYAQGNKFSLMLISTIYSSLQASTYPIFSHIQNDKERSLRSYRKTMRFTAFLTFPLLIGMISVAHPFISLILKAEWIGCVPFFQLTCLAGIFTIMSIINQNFAKAQGRSDIIFKLEIARTILIMVGLAATFRQSALVMVACLALTQLLVYIISIITIGKAVGYNWLQQVKDIAPYALISTAMWGILLIPDYFTTINYLLLPLKIIIGIAFYYATNRILGSTILNEATQLIFKHHK